MNNNENKIKMLEIVLTALKSSLKSSNDLPDGFIDGFDECLHIINSIGLIIMNDVDAGKINPDTSNIKIRKTIDNWEGNTPHQTTKIN